MTDDQREKRLDEAERHVNCAVSSGGVSPCDNQLADALYAVIRHLRSPPKPQPDGKESPGAAPRKERDEARRTDSTAQGSAPDAEAASRGETASVETGRGVPDASERGDVAHQARLSPGATAAVPDSWKCPTCGWTLKSTSGPIRRIPKCPNCDMPKPNDHDFSVACHFAPAVCRRCGLQRTTLEAEQRFPLPECIHATMPAARPASPPEPLPEVARREVERQVLCVALSVARHGLQDMVDDPPRNMTAARHKAQGILMRMNDEQCAVYERQPVAPPSSPPAPSDEELGEEMVFALSYLSTYGWPSRDRSVVHMAKLLRKWDRLSASQSRAGWESAGGLSVEEWEALEIAVNVTDTTLPLWKLARSALRKLNARAGLEAAQAPDERAEDK